MISHYLCLIKAIALGLVTNPILIGFFPPTSHNSEQARDSSSPTPDGQ
ncbi:hypothetical protein SPLC1_S030580 [Arthrospira platensis C1]|nr:hypothetical protein SPLC1_S030580 [Arthrospira platensis C1]